MTDPLRPSGHVLQHLLAPRALRELRELARRLEREEVFRLYVQQRILLVLPAVFLPLAFAFFGTLAGVAIFVRSFEPPLGRSVHLTLAGVGFVFWLVVAVTYIYFLFSWLERRATKKK